MMNWLWKWLARPVAAAVFGSTAVQGAGANPFVGLLAGLMSVLTAIWMIVDILDVVSQW
ncbi:hypothetical protein ACKFKG_22880 [Phormidesmis sp. 146-35]